MTIRALTKKYTNKKRDRERVTRKQGPENKTRQEDKTNETRQKNFQKLSVMIIPVAEQKRSIYLFIYTRMS